jgi:hypothetical protein
MDAVSGFGDRYSFQKKQSETRTQEMDSLFFSNKCIVK